MELVKRFSTSVVLLVGLFAMGQLTLASDLPTRKSPATQPAKPETGLASFYHDKYHGRQTASGEIFDTYSMTAAHRTLPFGTVVRVTDPKSSRSVTVRIVDRGPFVTGRVIDLSRAAARKLNMEQAGLLAVKVEVLIGSSALARK